MKKEQKILYQMNDIEKRIRTRLMTYEDIDSLVKDVKELFSQQRQEIIEEIEKYFSNEYVRTIKEDVLQLINKKEEV